MAVRLTSLCALFALILTFATALDCSKDLSLYEADILHPGAIARCDAGCDSCNFTLAEYQFCYSTVECLANVPCFVKVTTDTDMAMYSTTVDGSQASALSVDTKVDATFAWLNAQLKAPANKGDFRFEVANSQYALCETTFQAVNSGVVEILVKSDGLNNPFFPELNSMFVYASTAEELSIVLGADTRYANEIDSSIQCPAEGTCKWQSNGQRFDAISDYMRVMNLIISDYTNLQLLCEGNAESCDGVVVHCGDSADTCNMQYAGDWQCIGTLDLANGCAATHTTTTTAMPTTDTKHTTTMITMTTVIPMTTVVSTSMTMAPPNTTTTMANITTTNGKLLGTTPKATSDKSANKNLKVYIAAGGFCAVVCLFVAVVAYFRHKNKLLRAQMNARDNAHNNDNDSVAVDRRLIQAQPGAAPDFVQRRNGESPVGEQSEDGERIQRPSVARGEGIQRPSVARSEGVEKPVDISDEDEQLYIGMGTSTFGQTES